MKNSFVIPLILLLAFSSLDSLGQIFSVDFVVVNKEQNDEWLKKLESVDLNKQVQMIQDRLLVDTITYVKGPGDRIILKPLADSVKIDVYCRPIIIVDGQTIYIKNNTPTTKIKELVSLLTAEKVSNLEIVKDEKATALYGSQGLCGLILMTTNDKKIKKKINKLEI